MTTVLTPPAAPRHELDAPAAAPDSLASMLRMMVDTVARHTDLWSAVTHHSDDERHPVCLLSSDEVELWVIGWTPGQGLEFHDHGGSVGLLRVVAGQLHDVELSRGRTATRSLGPGSVRRLRSTTIHAVNNAGTAPATSIHAYSPPLTGMTHYDESGQVLVREHFERARPALPGWVGSQLFHPAAPRGG